MQPRCLIVLALELNRPGSLTWFCHFLRSPHTLRCLVSRWAWNPCPVSYRNTMSKHTEYSFRHTIHKARFSRCCSTPRVLMSFLSFLHSLLRCQPWCQPALTLHPRRSLNTLLSYKFPHLFSVRVIHPFDVLPHRWLSSPHWVCTPVFSYLEHILFVHPLSQSSPEYLSCVGHLCVVLSSLGGWPTIGPFSWPPFQAFLHSAWRVFFLKSTFLVFPIKFRMKFKSLA